MKLPHFPTVLQLQMTSRRKRKGDDESSSSLSSSSSKAKAPRAAETKEPTRLPTRAAATKEELEGPNGYQFSSFKDAGFVRKRMQRTGPGKQWKHLRQMIAGEWNSKIPSGTPTCTLRDDAVAYAYLLCSDLAQMATLRRILRSIPSRSTATFADWSPSTRIQRRCCAITRRKS